MMVLRRDCKAGLLVLCIVLLVASLLPPASCRERPSVMADLAARLTSDSWVKDLGTEHYVYTFFKDGHYTSKFITDTNTEPITGQWRLTKDAQGRAHLVLKNGRNNYYWLQQDSLIGYDKNRDILLVSGKNYVGVQQLRRQKDAPNAISQPARVGQRTYHDACVSMTLNGWAGKEFCVYVPDRS